MKTKLIITLTALLMLVGISAQAQTDNQTRANAESTELEGDLNHDNKVDVADVTYLVNLIMKNQSEAKDGTYYWYIGVENPASISDIQTDNTKPGWHEIGSSLSGFVFDTNNQANQITLVENATSMDDAVQYYVVIPNGLSIYNGLNYNMIDDLHNFTPVTCNISGYNAYQYYTKVLTVKGPIIKEGTSNEPINDNFYWYIGIDNPASISDIQTDNTKPGWHEIGASLSGFVLDGNTNTIELYTTNTNSYYYIIIPNKLGIYDGLGNDMTTTSDFEEVTCNINGYKAYKSTYQVRIVQGEIIKESTSNKPINDNFYWYIGAENPSSISNIQTDNTKPGWHEIGTSLSGFELHTTDNPIEFSSKVRYYLVIPNELNVYDDDEADGKYLFGGNTIDCNISGYKAYQYYNPNGVWDVTGIIIKEGIPVSGVSISTSESSINVGNTLQLEVAVEPSSATNKNVTWSSSNPEIATVDEATGLVTGIALGTATIIATSVDGGKTATTRVEVVDQLSDYYWYIGIENPSSISNIQTDNTKPGWHSIGSSLAGFRLDTTGGKSNRITLTESN